MERKVLDVGTVANVMRAEMGGVHGGVGLLWTAWCLSTQS